MGSGFMTANGASVADGFWVVDKVRRSGQKEHCGLWTAMGYERLGEVRAGRFWWFAVDFGGLWTSDGFVDE